MSFAFPFPLALVLPAATAVLVAAVVTAAVATDAGTDSTDLDKSTGAGTGTDTGTGADTGSSGERCGSNRCAGCANDEANESEAALAKADAETGRGRKAIEPSADEDDDEDADADTGTDDDNDVAAEDKSVESAASACSLFSEANADGVSAGDEAEALADSGGEPAPVPDTGAVTGTDAAAATMEPPADWWFASALTAYPSEFTVGFLRADASRCAAWSLSLCCGAVRDEDTDRDTDRGTDARGGTVMERGCALLVPLLPPTAAGRVGGSASRSSSPPSPSSSIKPISAASSALRWALFQQFSNQIHES